MVKCLFSNDDARVVPLEGGAAVSVKTDRFGEYWITHERIDYYLQPTNVLSARGKGLCLQEIVLLNREKLIPFWCNSANVVSPQNVVFRSIQDVAARAPSHHAKDRTLLNGLAEKLRFQLNPFGFIGISDADRYSWGMFDESELFEWIGDLHDAKLIAFSYQTAQLFLIVKDNPGVMPKILSCLNGPNIGLTTNGWKRVHERGSGSKSAFIAMAFTNLEGEKVPPALRDCIKSSIQSLGYSTMIVDEQEHNDGIMDKVISLIKQSRFVVADLTYQKSGVYYEAGYAKALDLPVIHTVQEENFSNCHFDVKHLNLIVYDDLDELRARLTNRVMATVGKAI
jgi:hypothetical protein